MTRQEIVAAVAAGRMTAAEAYRLLGEEATPAGASDEPREDLLHGVRIARRCWLPLAAQLPAADTGATVIITDGTDSQSMMLNELVAGEVLLELPESAADPVSSDAFDTYWTEHVQDRVRGCDHLVIVFRDPTPSMANRDTVLLFRVFQVLAHLRRTTSLAIDVVVDRQDEEALAWAMACDSFLACVRLERPLLDTRVVVVETQASLSRVVALGAELRSRGVAARLARTDASGSALLTAQVTKPGQFVEDEFLEEVDFLVTGGTGGLARVLAGGLLKRGAGHVTLCGRRGPEDLDADLVQLIERNRDRVCYVRWDPADDEDLVGLACDAVRANHRLVILHAAGVRNDAFLVKQNLKDFLTTAVPKVSMTRVVMEAARSIPNSTVVLFSSVTSLFGNIGQCAYGFANGHMDGCAVAARESSGGELRVLSVNWPLWDEGGMQLDEGARRMMSATTGMEPLPTAVGLEFLIRALYDGWQGDEALLYGDLDKLAGLLGANEAPPDRAVAREAHAPAMGAPAVPPRSCSSISAHELHRRACSFLVEVVSGVTEIPQSDIDIHAAFDQFGLDSIVAMRIGDELEANFSGLSKTLLFEYQNITDLASYFVDAHYDELLTVLGIGGSSLDDMVEQPPAAPTPSVKADRPEVQHPAVAIIGIAGRYPGATSLDQFWENLVHGVDSVREIPAERWDNEQIYDTRKGQLGRTNSRWGGFLDGIDQFDPRLFRINAREAMIMDPQERIFLETAWTAVQDAGYKVSDLHGCRVGVFVGAMYSEYQMLPACVRGRNLPHTSLHSSIANRVSYYLDLNGPSVAMDTMCSSSLVAIHYGARSILDGEATMAIAGGVNLSLTPDKYLFLAQGNFLSSDGRCRAFGEGGDGYVPGEGVGAVLLKSLEHALADGDHIYGVIRGSAVNHDGKTSGYTVPSPQAQADVISAALEQSGLEPARVSYVEAHGTGTSLGDPIEISGLKCAYGGASLGRIRAIGSVKSNIGHTESAAGIASLTKVLLQMKHHELVPSLHATRLNPMIDFDNAGFTVQRELGAWHSDGAPRVAGISCFGAGGTNCHMIVEEPAATPVRTMDPERVFVPFSSTSDEQLRALLEKYVTFLASDDARAMTLVDIAHTMTSGRDRMNAAVIIFASSIEELRERIMGFLTTGHTDANVLYRPSVEQTDDVGFLLEGEQGDDMVAHLIEQRSMEQLARVWLLGRPVDSRRLFPMARRVSLPTHVFDHDSYWLPGDGSAATESALCGVLDRNESDFDGIRFTSFIDTASEVKSAYIAPDAIVDPMVAPQLAHDGFQQLMGDEPDSFENLRLIVAPSGPAPCSFTVRADRGGAMTLLEVTDGDGAVVFQTAAGTTAESGSTATSRGGEPVLSWPGGMPDPGSIPLVTVLRACMAACTTDQSGLLGVGAVRIFSSFPIIVVRQMPALDGGDGIDLEFGSATGDVVALATNVVVTPFTLQDASMAVDDGGGQEAPVDRPPDVRAFILEVASELFGVPSSGIDEDMPFDEYGIDSVLIGKFVEAIRTRFPSMPETSFFDHTTVRSLTTYLSSLEDTEPVVAAIPAAPTAVTRSRPSVPMLASVLPDGAGGNDDEPIAIIGMSGVFPEAADLGEYWDNLRAGRESISLVPADRWDYRAWFDPETDIPTPGKIYAPWGGFIDDPYGFDHAFFNITPADARVIDPQERMLLETIWHTLEDAGRTRSDLMASGGDDLAENVGVFVGSTNHTYEFWGVEEWARGNAVATNSSPWSLANRLSYFFNFSGPSMPVDTACSSGLTALHLAVGALRRRECTSAVVAGVNLYLHPMKYVAMCQMKMLSPTGHLSAFGADADGFVPGEGVAAVLLKPISRALADGDRVRAVIRASELNHGGRSNGYTVPNGVAQTRLLQRAWRRCGVSPSTIGYLEMHGTGTRLGDPIEVEAATRAMRDATDRQGFCAMGSVKSNIGHLESCAGLAALVKVVQQMEHGVILPTINAHSVNPRLKLEHSPFVLAHEEMTWQPDERSGVRRAGINAFGAGGSNAHVVIESFDEPESARPAAGDELIVLSAREAERLPVVADELAYALERDPDVDLQRVAHTLRVGREPLASRLAFVAHDADHAVAVLKAISSGRAVPEVMTSEDRDPTAMIVGQDRLSAAAAAWVCGDPVEWPAWDGRFPCRVSLPGYPFRHASFVQERTIVRPASAEEARRAEVTVRNRHEDFRIDEELRRVDAVSASYMKDWERVTPELQQAGRWSERLVVVCAQESHDRTAIAEALRDEGARVLEIHPDAARHGEKVPGDVTDVIWMPQNVNPCHDDPWSREELESHDRSLVDFLALLKTIAARGSGAPVCNVHIVTDRVQDLDGGCVRMWGAGSSAMLRCVTREHVNIRGVAIDMDLSSGVEPADLVTWVGSIRCTTEVDELIVRDALCRRLRLSRVEVPAARGDLAAPDSVHVIFGGLGSLGFELACHLVKNCGARVCLVGRSPIDHDRRQLMDRLGGEGSRVMYRRADATDESAVRSLLDDVMSAWGRIDCLVHTAMVFGESTVEDLTDEELLDMLRPKTRMVQAILRASRDMEIERFIAFSSSQGFLGAPRRAHYAAACAGLMSFLDSMRSQLNMTIHRIDWGYWGAVRGRRISREYAAFLDAHNIRPISVQEGMDVVARVVTNEMPALTVLTVGDLVRSTMSILDNAQPRAWNRQRAAKAIHNAPARPMPETDEEAHEGSAQTFEEVRSALMSDLAQTISSSASEIDPSQSFMDIGLDSISGLKFVRNVNSHRGYRLPDTVVFEYPSIDALAWHIIEAPPIIESVGPATDETVCEKQIQTPDVAPPANSAAMDEAEEDFLTLLRKLESNQITPEQAIGKGEVK